MNTNMQILFDSLRDSVVIADDEGRVKYANKVAGKTLGILSGQKLPGDSIPLQLKAARQGYLKLPMTLEVDAPGQRSQVDHLRVTIMESPVGNDYVVVLHNLTEAQFYENTIHNLAELIDQELKAPLNKLTQAIDVLTVVATGNAQPGAAGMEIQDTAVTVIEVGAQLGRQIEQLRVFGETFGHAPMRADERLVIPDLVSKVLLKVRPYLQARRIRVSLAGIGDELPVIYGSSAWLSQALAEYIRSLAKQAKEGAEFLFTVKSNGNFVMFQIEDRGCGIPSHLRERAFLPFHRGNGDDSGLGLGLALCKRIVELHGGHVRFVEDSDELGEFIIEIPVGATSSANEDEIALLQAQRYAQDLARLMQRAVGTVN